MSWLTQDEVDALELEQEPQLCSKYGIHFLTFPYNRSQRPGFATCGIGFCERVRECLVDGKKPAYSLPPRYWSFGFDRGRPFISSGMEVESALQKISAARGFVVPETPEHLKWVMNFESEPAKPLL